MSEARPLVPESNALDTRRWRNLKTILIWTVLILIFAAVFRMLPAEASEARLVLFWIPGGLIIAIFAANVIRLRRQMTRFVRESNEGFAALARGDLRRAHDIYWAWSERAKFPRIAALSRHNLGWTLMRQGELHRALAVATDNDARHPGALTAIGLFPTSGVDIALYQALLGNTQAAERALIETEQRTTLMKLPSLPSMKAFARAVLDCRTGRPEDAARLLDEHWAEHEALLTGDILRPLRIVRAFAIAASGPRNAGIADTMLAAARPAYPGEYDFLGVAWPEMAAFLTSHGLSRGTVADAPAAT